MSVKQNKQILKLDDAANTAAYNEALQYFESLGFRGKTASDLAIEKVHNNVLFDAGTLPDVDIVAKAWGDGDDASRRENYQKAQKTKREEETKKQQSEFNQNIRNATDKWGYSIGSGLEMISGFTPLWWVAPAVRTGLNLSEGNYKGAALNAGLAFAAPYAVGKGIQYISPYAKSAILANKLNRQIRNTKLPQSQLNVTELHPHSRVKVGDVEINDPNLAYRQAGESIAKEFPITGRQIPTVAESGYGIERATKPTGIILGKVPFKNPMYAQGHLWYGIPQQKSTLSGLLVTNQPLQYANMTANTVNTPNIITSKDGLVTRVFDPNSNLFSVGTRRIPSPGQLNSTNTSSYIYEPGYGYRKVITQQPKTSLAFFERQPAKISEAERLGISKGDRGNLSRFQKEALEDLTIYRNKWIRQKYPQLDSNGNIIWSNGTNKSFLDTYVAPLRGDQYKGVQLYPHIEDDGSYLMRMSMGSDDLNGGFAGYDGISAITLTSPKMNAINQEIPIPIEQASPTLPKEGVKTFWEALQDIAQPGSYISGDFGGRPLGYNLIRQYNKIGTPIVSTTNTGVRAIIGRNGYQNVINELFRKIPWKSHYDGLSTDSYMALLKQGNRPGYKLRFSKDGFTNWNHQSFENKYIQDLYEQALIDPTKQQEFLKVFHDWVAPYGGHDAVIKNGKIIIPQPFIVRQKSGGSIHIKKENKGKFAKVRDYVDYKNNK